CALPISMANMGSYLFSTELALKGSYLFPTVFAYVGTEQSRRGSSRQEHCGIRLAKPGGFRCPDARDPQFRPVIFTFSIEAFERCRSSCVLRIIDHSCAFLRKDSSHT